MRSTRVFCNGNGWSARRESCVEDQHLQNPTAGFFLLRACATLKAKGKPGEFAFLMNRPRRCHHMTCYSSSMITTVDAVYEDGKLVLQQPLPLPEHAHVRVTIDSDLEREAWLKVSQESLNRVWDNLADDVFNDLLQK